MALLPENIQKIIARILILGIFCNPISDINAASSGRFRVHADGLVASDTAPSSSSNRFTVQSRSKFEQTHGTSTKFQIYSSFSAEKNNALILSTSTPVDGNVATNPINFLNDNGSMRTSRDTKANHLAEVVELGDHIPMVAGLNNADTFVITENLINFVRPDLQEPIMFFPVDRVTNDSRKIMVGIPSNATMNTTPTFMGPLVKTTLPSIENFSAKYAIDLPTNTPVTFSEDIDICLYGTTASTGIANAVDVDVFYSNDNINWLEDSSAKNKQYVAGTEQFCFQTNHLTKFVIGKKSAPVVTPPTAPTVTSSGGGGSGGGNRYGWNPQSIIAGSPTRSKTFRMVREEPKSQDPSGLKQFLLWDPNSPTIKFFSSIFIAQNDNSKKETQTPQTATQQNIIKSQTQNTVIQTPSQKAQKTAKKTQEEKTNQSNTKTKIPQKTKQETIEQPINPILNLTFFNRDNQIDSSKTLSKLREKTNIQKSNQDTFRGSAPSCEIPADENNWFSENIWIIWFLLGLFLGAIVDYLFERYENQKKEKQSLKQKLKEIWKKIRGFFTA